jgi:hypothetical protein
VEELAALPSIKLPSDECEQIAQLGDNKGCMELKGANRAHIGEPLADRWSLTPDLESVAKRWGIDADRDLVCTHEKAV